MMHRNYTLLLDDSTNLVYGRYIGITGDPYAYMMHIATHMLR